MPKEMDTVVETYIKLPKDEYDNMLSLFKKVSKDLDLIKSNLGTSNPDTSDERITIQEFADKLKIGSTSLKQMISGTHKSGFILRTYRKPGTRKTYTYRSEIERYFDGF